MPGLTPGLFLQQGRYNNSLDPSSYDPNNFVDPYAAIAMQQQLAQQIFRMQNPRLALPQQFGAALGGAAQQLMRPQTAGGAPQGASGPSTDQGKALHDAAVQMQQQNPGMPFNEALYKSADAMESNPQWSEDPTMEKVLDHARDWAKKNGYNPNFEREKQIEAKNRSGENLLLPNGKKIMAIPGTPEYQAYMTAGALKQGDVPQIAVGERRQAMRNGLYVEEEYDGNKWNVVGKSPQPVQYAATVTGQDAQSVWPGGPKAWDNAAAAKTTEELTNRSIATKNFVDAIDKLQQVATPESIGKPGDVNEMINNVRASIGTFAAQMGVSPNPKDYNWTPVGNGKLIDQMRKNGIDAEKVKSLMLASAMLKEATEGDKNATDANRKYSIEMRMKELGEDSSDIEALKATLQQNREMAVNNLNNEFEGKPNVMSKPPWLQTELSKKNGGDRYNTPEDIRAAYQAKKISREQAKALLKSHGFD